VTLLYQFYSDIAGGSHVLNIVLCYIKVAGARRLHLSQRTHLKAWFLSVHLIHALYLFHGCSFYPSPWLSLKFKAF